MADEVPVPAEVAGRTFQVWDYTPSHRTLLLRSPSGSSNPENIDIRAVGVREMDVATRLEVVEVRRVHHSAAGALTLYKFVLIGPDDVWTVVAEDLKFETNTKALFEGLADAAAQTFEEAKRLEVEVVATVATLVPESAIERNVPRRPDIGLTVEGRRAFIETIWTYEQSVDRQVRRLVMERLPRWDQDALADSLLIVVIGGARSNELAPLLRSALTTALPRTKVEALNWDAAGPSSLAQLLDAQLRRPVHTPTSVFEVFQDASGGYRWRLRAANGETLAVSESYASRQNALRGVERVSSTVGAAQVIEGQ